MITQESKFFASSDASLPPLVMQITHLVGSYMIWIGTTDVQPENMEAAISRGRLCQDWACAMPPTSVRCSTVPPAATSICRSSASDVALPMAQRLARRFKKQIFLSVDIPPSFAVTGQAPQIAVEMERRAFAGLKETEGS
ncbi:hypothetical protein SCHPADRAFT_838956 [Schizopora paradoxa]|uniref:Uncharacterized protein n=1 Tax=Schizopora paradoxa TaxID=27342 RepID=A0A0H2R8A0_9AGAM|nr:hypothetical protein SCHPADRAFT_838956 [Schizopora paradoxa]